MVLVHVQEGGRWLTFVELQLIDDSIRIALHAVEDLPGALSIEARAHKEICAGSASCAILIEGEPPFYFQAIGEGWRLCKLNRQLVTGCPAIEYAKDRGADRQGWHR